jgi:hypothetical protein
MKILFWSAAGQVGCNKRGHTPFVGTDTWIHEGWKKIPAAQARAWEKTIGTPPECEVCEEERKRKQR